MEVWKIIFLSKWVICSFYVNLPGCTLWDCPNFLASGRGCPNEIPRVTFGETPHARRTTSAGSELLSNPGASPKSNGSFKPALGRWWFDGMEGWDEFCWDEGSVNVSKEKIVVLLYFLPQANLFVEETIDLSPYFSYWMLMLVGNCDITMTLENYRHGFKSQGWKFNKRWHCKNQWQYARFGTTRDLNVGIPTF